MTKEELEKATGQELIDERNYCGVDGYYGVYLDNVNAEMLKRFNRLAEFEEKLANADYQLEGRDLEIKELKAQIEKMKCCENCGWYYLQQHWRESKEIDESRMFHCGTCGNKRNWKLKEIKNG